MPIIDYLKKTVDNCIIIPPFHTGHLGFIPGLEVTVGLINPTESNVDDDCEVCVTPYSRDTSGFFRMECTMLDQPGVVHMLAEAISSLRLNVVSAESYCIDHLNFHVISLVLDWSTTSLPDERLSPSAMRLYADVSSMFPAYDNRYMILLERLIAYCGDVIAEKTISGYRSMPRISFTPFEKRIVPERHAAVLESVKPKSFHISLRIPDKILKMVCSITGQKIDDSLSYIILSEPETKTLRVFFPKKGREIKFVHVAFIHMDKPGALSAITDIIAKTNFNISTSLLRKEDPNCNIFETILEYRGNKNPPMKKGDIPRWIENIIAASVSKQQRNILNRYEVSVTLPRYPKIENGIEEISLKTGKEIVIEEEDKIPIEQRISQTIERLKQLKPPYLHDRLRLIEIVEKRFIKRKPSIFLSYPEPAGIHASLLKESLDDIYEVREYMEADLEVITKAVINQIAACDYFIGIWHHEKNEKSGYSVSPWLPFEYGIAKALKKPFAIVYSEKLPKSITDRIDHGVSKPKYADVTFERKTIPIILDYCKEHWPSMERYQVVTGTN
jgi:predicted amino acid-binding ACT domain protein